MTKFIKLGTAVDFTGLRRFDFYLLDDELVQRNQTIVSEAYKRFESVPKGGG